MKLIDLLQALGLTLKEVRSRFAMKEIAINGVLCTAIDTEIKLASEEKIGYTELGDFLFEVFMHSEGIEISDLILKHRLKYGDCNMFFHKGEDKLTKFLSGFTCISISKRDHLVFMK